LKTRFIVVGTGNRGLGCFAKGLLGFDTKGLPEFPKRAELVAMVDTNLTRGQACAKELKRPDIRVYKTITEAQKHSPADWCIVTTPDFTHGKIVTEALEAGLNVLVDKPLATSVWECDTVIGVMKRTGKQVIVGHNLRYQAWALQAARMVRAGAIGHVISVEAAEVLDYGHGGDYFHRWHSDFSKSAGLMTHKCCHYLDVLCWILNDDPIEVSAAGGRSFYTPRPELNHGDRCSQCQIAKSCPHFFDLDKWDGVYRRIYKEAENDDGYIRDQCVFSDRHTINDHESLRIRFSGGSITTFSLVTFAPRGFCYFNFTGTTGRLETGYSSVNGEPYLRLTGEDKKVQDIDVKSDDDASGHGGADIRLIADRLGLGESDPLQRATPAEARRAVLISDLAARSIAAGGWPMKPETAGRDFPPAPPQKR